MARKTDVNENTLHSWVKKYARQEDVKATQSFSSAEAELKALKKHYRDLEEENEILKKAMHYFAKSPR
ncbi:transposase [Bacillus sp. A116_S68]|nr:transposase [Bacillus sp. A116_S68]